ASPRLEETGVGSESHRAMLIERALDKWPGVTADALVQFSGRLRCHRDDVGNQRLGLGHNQRVVKAVERHIAKLRREQLRAVIEIETEMRRSAVRQKLFQLMHVVASERRGIEAPASL